MNYFNMNSIIYLQYTTLQLSLLDQNPNSMDADFAHRCLNII